MYLRRPLSLLLSLGLLLSGPLAKAEAYPTATPMAGYTLRASAEDILVFATPNKKANLVGCITANGGQTVYVQAVDGDWCLVTVVTNNGTSYGYIPLSYFDVAPASTPTPAPASTASYAAGTLAWVNNSMNGYRLNLREEPSTTARSLGKYYTGTPLVLTGLAENGFVQVLVAGMTVGWMDAHYITDDELAFVPEIPTVTIASMSGTVLRSGPGTQFDRLSRIDYGTPITIFGVRSDGWYHVQVDEQVGYLSETVLSGTFPYEYGMDSDNLAITEQANNTESIFYINTRSTSSVLHLRKSASSSAKSLGTFYTGTPLTVLSYTRTGWAYVRIGQTEGYMDASYFTATPPTQFGDRRIVRNTRANGLNLRSIPSTGGELLSFVSNGSPVTVLGVLSDGWCFVQYGELQGYMLSSGLSSTK